jgi:hypothetical protein
MVKSGRGRRRQAQERERAKKQEREQTKGQERRIEGVARSETVRGWGGRSSITAAGVFGGGGQGKQIVREVGTADWIEIEVGNERWGGG